LHGPGERHNIGRNHNETLGGTGMTALHASDATSFDYGRLAADLERLLRLRSFPFAMKMYEDRAEM
jgi:hypothetical protein